MSPRTASPSVAQLYERTRQLIASARTQSVGASVKREQVIRELRFAGQRRELKDAGASAVYQSVAELRRDLDETFLR